MEEEICLTDLVKPPRHPGQGNVISADFQYLGDRAQGHLEEDL